MKNKFCLTANGEILSKEQELIISLSGLEQMLTGVHYISQNWQGVVTIHYKPDGLKENTIKKKLDICIDGLTVFEILNKVTSGTVR